MMNKTRQAAAAPMQAHNFIEHLTDDVVSKSRYWWLLLITGVAWIVIAFVIPRYAYATVAATSILFGALCLAAGLETPKVLSEVHPTPLSELQKAWR